MSAPRVLPALALALLLAAAAVVVLLLVGRPQITAQAVTAGGQMMLVRTATIDLLVADGTPMGRAPECAIDGELVVCTGTRADGAPIRSSAPVTPPSGGTAMVTVTVDGRTVASRPARDVVDGAGTR